MSLLSVIMPKGPSGFGYGSTAEEVSEGLDLSGRRYLVTGCNSGLGMETVRVLQLRGGTVVGAARTVEKAAHCDEAVACDLSEPDSVREAVHAIQGPLDGIVANAGIMALPQLQVRHGLELQFLTNHMGHARLVLGLQEQLTPLGRVVMLSSAGHKSAPQVGIDFDNLDGSRGYSPWRFYGQAKLANLLFARALADRLPEGQSALAVHPGVIATNLTRHMNPLMQLGWKAMSPLVLKSVHQGAATQVWAAVHPEPGAHNGEYLSDCNTANSSPRGMDMALWKRLWDYTEDWLKS